MIQGEAHFSNVPIYQGNVYFGSLICKMLVKLKVTVEMRSIVIVIGDRLGKVFWVRLAFMEHAEVLKGHLSGGACRDLESLRTLALMGRLKVRSAPLG